MSFKIDRRFPIPVPCPNCKRKNQATLGELERSRFYRCRGCQTSIRIKVDPQSLGKAERDVNKQLDRIRKIMK